jgi:hypothetical protein
MNEIQKPNSPIAFIPFTKIKINILTLKYARVEHLRILLVQMKILHKSRLKAAHYAKRDKNAPRRGL